MNKFIPQLRAEGLALAVLIFTLTYYSSAPLWILPATFLLFDLCMIGYLFGPKVGAISYNIVHNWTIPLLTLSSGLILHAEWLYILGLCWAFHNAVDRAFGYGLKSGDSFNHTHLGVIGNKKSKK